MQRSLQSISVLSAQSRRPFTEAQFSAHRVFFVIIILCVRVPRRRHRIRVLASEHFLIASRQGQRLRSAMRGMSEGLRSQRLQPTPESRAHCVAAEGEQKAFPPEELWVPVDKEAKRRGARGRVYTLVYSGDVYAEQRRSLALFQTTSGGCINSRAWRNIKAVGAGAGGGEKIPPL